MREAGRALARFAQLSDDALHAPVLGATPQFRLYAMLRAEQAAATAHRSTAESEPAAIMRFAQAAFGDLAGLLVGRSDGLLDDARDGDWSLRDLLRHMLAVEVRYLAGVRWAIERADSDPLETPVARLPGDRLSPPEPEFAGSRTGGVEDVVGLLRSARERTDAPLSNVAATDLERPARWGTIDLTVRTRMHQIGVHLVEHTIQAERLIGASDGEARRVVRRILATRAAHERTTPADALMALDSQWSEHAAALGA